MALLCLDLGTRCGYALSTPAGVVSGVANFKGGRFEGGGMRYLYFTRWLEKMHAQVPIDEVAYEEVRRHAGTDAAHVYGGLQGVLTSWCESYGIPYAGYPVGTIKKAACGNGNATKAQMIEAAAGFGYADKIEDDNHADALCLLHMKLVELTE